MSIGPMPVAARASGSDPLAHLLHAHFARVRLGRLGLAYMYGSTLPALGLWARVRWPLPDLVGWFAGLAWGACAVLALSLGILARRWRMRFEEARVGASGVASVEFPAEDTPPASSVFAALSMGAAGFLWIQGIAPGWLSTQLVAFSGAAWAMLSVLALGVRCFER